MELVNFKNGINFSRNKKLEDKGYNLRRHSLSLTREKVKNCLPRFNFFTNRVVNSWNQLTEEVTNAKNLNVFKTKLDVWFMDHKETTAIAH
ncbi:unnamed protein product [Brachionus calyciflorus]|uniref:Uncharacterized protein n=1 Tax=Brachionus calyciflorus TaxID=104777 RepID=A0A813PIW3_9BILA|nr:unnamed protein product [Brachionus calyciflorus]